MTTPQISPDDIDSRSGASSQSGPAQSASAPDPLKVFLRVARLQQRVTAALAVRLREIGLSIPQFDVISTLTEEEGVTQQELAARLYVTKGNVSGLLDRMAEAGLVERRATPGDRRARAVHLTERGRVLAQQGMALQRNYVAQTLGQVSDSDLADLDRILRSWRDFARRQDDDGA